MLLYTDQRLYSRAANDPEVTFTFCVDRSRGLQGFWVFYGSSATR